MDELQPTEGREWRAPREKGITVKLPSGHVARLRPVGLDLLVRVGYVPSILGSYIIDMIERGKGELPKEATLDDEKEWFRFLDCLVELAFVSPKVVKDPQADDEISVDDVELGDKMEIWKLLGAPARELVSYFRQTEERPQAMAASEVHPPTGEPDLERDGVGQPAAGDAGPSDGDHGR